jgi:phasin family protein
MPQSAPFDPGKFFDIDYSALGSALGQEGDAPFDYAALLEIARKNLQALNEAHNLALSSFHSLARRQSDMLSEIVEDHASMARALFSEGTPQEKIVRQADLMKSLYEHNAANARELLAILRKSGTEAADVLNRRVSASFCEFKGAVNGRPEKPAAAAAGEKKPTRAKA